MRTDLFFHADPTELIDRTYAPEDIDPIDMRTSFAEFTWPTLIGDDRRHFYELDTLLQHIETGGGRANRPFNPAETMNVDDIVDVSWPGHDTLGQVRARILDHLKAAAARFVGDAIDSLLEEAPGDDERVLTGRDFHARMVALRHSAHPHMHTFAVTLALIALCQNDEGHLLVYDAANDTFVLRPSEATRARIQRYRPPGPPRRLRELVRVLRANRPPQLA